MDEKILLGPFEERPFLMRKRLQLAIRDLESAIKHLRRIGAQFADVVPDPECSLYFYYIQRDIESIHKKLSSKETEKKLDKCIEMMIEERRKRRRRRGR